MPLVTYDTNVFIKYKPAHFPAGFVMSAVVIQGLAAGAVDKSEIQALNAARLGYEKQGRLLVPNSEDWWMAGKVLNSLLRGHKSQASQHARRIFKGEQQRILRDVLIARTARRAGAIVVTDNIADFERIKSFCRVRIKRPAEIAVR
jgi:predicted nucleic acid-binding protein